MRPILTSILLFAFTQLSYAVGNEVVDDLAALERIGFSFRQSEHDEYLSSEKTMFFTVGIPSHHVSGYGKMPFAGAAYFKPEDPGAKGPKLISTNGLKIYLAHADEEVGHSLTLSVLVAEIAGTYLEFCYDRGKAPMLVHVPLTAIVSHLERPPKAQQGGADQPATAPEAEPNGSR